MQRFNLCRHNHSTTTAKHLNALATTGFEQINHVFEKLDMPALIRRYGNAVRILLQGGGHDLVDRTIMPKMNHLNSSRLQNAPHDVDGGIMTIE